MCVLFACLLLLLMLFKSVCVVCVSSYSFDVVLNVCVLFAILLLLSIMFNCLCIVCVSSSACDVVEMFVYCVRFFFFC